MSLQITRTDYLQSISSINTREMNRKALNYWDLFLKSKKLKEDPFLDELRAIQKDPIFYQHLNIFVQFMIKKKLHPRSVKSYFSCFKQFLRSQGIRIYNEDVKQFVKFPKILREKKYAVTKQDIQKLLDKSPPRMKRLILCSTVSGTRVSELLQLKKSDLKKPYVYIRPEIAKLGVARTTFFSDQAWKILKKTLDQKPTHGYVFCSNYRPLKTLEGIEAEFDKIRTLSKLDNRYEISRVHHITIHRLRAFLKTLASDKVGKDYAEDLIGHEGYLSTYYNTTDSAKYKIYKEILMPELEFNL